jgi:hypothetical protein
MQGNMFSNWSCMTIEGQKAPMYKGQHSHVHSDHELSLYARLWIVTQIKLITSLFIILYSLNVYWFFCSILTIQSVILSTNRKFEDFCHTTDSILVLVLKMICLATK